MLEFRQNGKTIEVKAIYDKGKIGQMVIYGEQVIWDVNPNDTVHPLSQYSCPSIFSIVEKVVEEEKNKTYYILSDIKGNNIEVDDGSYLYDAQEWLKWNDMYNAEKLSNKNRRIRQLEDQVELLKDILIKQGPHIITEAQAEDLGLN